jgi:type IV pilus assembly protein PilF
MKPRRPGPTFRPGAVLSLLALLAGCASPVPDTNRTPDPLPEAPPKADTARLAQTRLELAAAYFQRGQNATALQEIKAALQADPNQVAAYGLRGLIYGAMGDPAQAEESFRQGLRLSARDPDTLHNYGWFLCQERRFAEADQQFGLAAQVPAYPDLARTLLAQGICQARAQRWPEAERTLARSYELDPANPATGFNLADVLYRRGEYERARFYVRRVNQIDEQLTAQSLWLALRIERKLGQTGQVDQLGSLLTSRFASSPEASLYERRRFDD